MQITITSHGAALAKTYGHRRLSVLSAAVLPWNKSEADIATATGFNLRTVQTEMKGLYTTGAITNATTKSPSKTSYKSAAKNLPPTSKATTQAAPVTNGNTKRLPLRHITDAQVLQTFQGTRSKTKTGQMLGMSRTGVRDRLASIVAKSNGKIVL